MPHAELLQMIGWVYLAYCGVSVAAFVTAYALHCRFGVGPTEDELLEEELEWEQIREERLWR